MSIISETWIDEFGEDAVFDPNTMAAMVHHVDGRSASFGGATGDQGYDILSFNTGTLTGTVTATNGYVSTVTVTAVVPTTTTLLGDDYPPIYVGPPRNRHERRAAAKDNARK